MHSSDLSHATKPFEIAKKWSLKVSTEFTQQVEEEHIMNLPVTSYLSGLDNIKNIAKQEIQFIKVIITPLF